jgi:hypothetical protein
MQWLWTNIILTYPSLMLFPEGAIVAYLNNGKRMTVLEKGPLWIVYPYDKMKNFKQKKFMHAASGRFGKS